MRAVTLGLLASLATSPALADVAEVVKDHILPGYGAFARAADDLALAGKTCDTKALQDGFHATYEAWARVQHLHLGPAEDQGRTLAVLYWPDPKGMGAKAQRALLTGDPAKLTPEAFAQQSVAARGLLALERLLWPATNLPADPCPLIAATTADLARLGHEIQDGWQAYAPLLTTPGNATYMTEAEARQALFTQLATGLEALADTRIGRPLGTFDAPHPDRAEARASGRSRANVVASLMGLRDLALALVPDAPRSQEAFAKVIARAEAIQDPDFAGITDPQAWLKLQILQQEARALRETTLAELGPQLGVTLGFNSADGD